MKNKAPHPQERTITDADQDDEKDRVREHLEPLGLAPEGTAIGELARLAAVKITQQ